MKKRHFTRLSAFALAAALSVITASTPFSDAFPITASVTVSAADETAEGGSTSSQNEVTFTVSGGTPGFANEGPDKLIDGKYTKDNFTKWCCSFSNSAYAVFSASEPVFINGYSIVTGNDNSQSNGRNPKSWVLYGSDTPLDADAEGWEVINKVENDTVLKDLNYTKYDFPLASSTTKQYKYFKFVVNAIQSGNTFQMSELILDYSTCDHQWEDTQEVHEATCTEGAYKIQKCSVCKMEKKVVTSEPLGHKYNENDICTVCGEKRSVKINEENFPDANFRNWILAQEYGQDGVLTVDEIAAVTEINVSNKSISDLTGIEYFTALTSLNCEGNPLTSLDVSKNTALTELDCSSNQLTSLDVSKSTNLIRLYCSYNQLTLLDLSKNTALTEFDCSSNQLTSLDVSKNTNLTRLECQDNPLTSLDLKATKVMILLANTLSEEYAYKTAFDGEKLDLTTLDGFDVSKASEWRNATIEGNIISIIDLTEPVTYTYDTGKGNVRFMIVAESVSLTADMIEKIADQTYTGKEFEPKPVVKCGDYTLVEGTDYTLSYDKNTDAGTGKVIVTAKGDFYTGSAEAEFKINKAEPKEIVLPTASGLTYGQKLSESVLSDENWKWVDGKVIPTVNNDGYEASIIVDDKNYDYSDVEGYNEKDHTVTRTIEVTVEKADPTVNPVIDDADYEDGDDLPEIRLSENDTLGKVEWIEKIAKLVEGKNILDWKFTPEDENYNDVTGTLIVNAKATTTTTTTVTTTTTAVSTTKATTANTTKATSVSTTKANVASTTKPTTTVSTTKATTASATKLTTAVSTTKATTANTTKPTTVSTTKATVASATKPTTVSTTKATTASATKPTTVSTTKATTTWVRATLRLCFRSESSTYMQVFAMSTTTWNSYQTPATTRRVRSATTTNTTTSSPR